MKRYRLKQSEHGILEFTGEKLATVRSRRHYVCGDLTVYRTSRDHYVVAEVKRRFWIPVEHSAVVCRDAAELMNLAVPNAMRDELLKQASIEPPQEEPPQPPPKPTYTIENWTEEGGHSAEFVLRADNHRYPLRFDGHRLVRVTRDDNQHNMTLYKTRRGNLVFHEENIPGGTVLKSKAAYGTPTDIVVGMLQPGDMGCRALEAAGIEIYREID